MQQGINNVVMFRVIIQLDRCIYVGRVHGKSVLLLHQLGKEYIQCFVFGSPNQPAVKRKVQIVIGTIVFMVDLLTFVGYTSKDVSISN